MQRLDRIGTAGRTFCVAAILGLAAAVGSPFAVRSVILVGAIALAAGAVTSATRVSGAWVATIEACLVALVIGLALPDATMLLPYLVVPTLMGGLHGGVRAVFVVLGAESLALGAMTLPALGVETVSADLLFSWLFTALGVGLLGSFVRQISVSAAPDDAPYRDAKELLTQLHSVSRRLPAGLDPVDIAGGVLAVAQEQLDAEQAVIFVRREGGVPTPLRYSDDAARESFWQLDAFLEECWQTQRPVHASEASVPAGRHRVAVPLRMGSQMTGVLVADCAFRPTKDRLDDLLRTTDTLSVRLDTALLFDEIRSIATAEERRRLAREVHDGIAQDIASLGYLVDDLTSTATDQSQAMKLRGLRSELTQVVSELRLSIFDLRSEVHPYVGLGAALSDYVREVGSRSSMTVHLTLTESATRLRPEVETELLRIAQEAITNARKHSDAENLWVDCRVDPPSARIEIRDDGRGMGRPRSDSYGLRIMQERADRIDASLQVRHAGADGQTGTTITVDLGEAEAPATTDSGSRILDRAKGRPWQQR